MSELMPGLHQIPQILGPRYLYQYLLVGNSHTRGARSLMIDTGCAGAPDDVILPYFRHVRFDPAWLDIILISHADVDHMGGNAAMRRAAPQALLACHRLDARWVGSRKAILAERYGWYRQFDMNYSEDTWAWLEANIGPDVRVDLQLSGDEVLLLDNDRPLRFLHLPGHSPGHMGVYDIANKAVIITDAVLWKGLLDMEGALISPPPYFVIEPYLEAIDRVLALDFDHLFTAHYDPISSEAARAWLLESKTYVQHTHETMAGILQGAGRPMTLPEMHAEANAAIGPYTVFAIEFAGPVHAHLEQLVASGQAERVTVDGLPAWQAV